MEKLKVVGALVCVMCLSSCLGIFNAQKRQMQVLDEQHYQVLIIPALDHENDAEIEYFKSRLSWAVYAYKNHQTDYIMFTGGSKNSVYNAAKVMKICAIAMGVSPNDVLVEQNGNSLKEKLYLSLKMCDDLNFDQVAFSSDHFEVRQAHKILEANEVDVPLIPTIYAISVSDDFELEVDLNEAIDLEAELSLTANEYQWESLKYCQVQKQ